MPCHKETMSRYRRPRLPGATLFFTVNQVDRGSGLLVEKVEVLREVVRRTRAERPFHIDAWVVLPDHMHCMWTLPEGDAEYSQRWGMIKARFTREVCRSGDTPTLVRNGYGANGGRLREIDQRVSVEEAESRGIPRPTRSDSPIWQKRFWDEVLKRVQWTVFKAERAKRTSAMRRTTGRMCGIAG